MTKILPGKHIALPLALLLSINLPVLAVEEHEQGTSLKDQMVNPEKAEKKIILPDGHPGALPLEEIEPPEEADYWAYWIPGLRKADSYLNVISDTVPFEFGGKLDILSDYISDGFNWGPHHLNLQQTYWGSYGGFTFEYFQADYFNKPRKIYLDPNENEYSYATTDPELGWWEVEDVEHNHRHNTIERDFTFSYDLSILDRVDMGPWWAYYNYPGYKDSQELGWWIEIDMPLHPAFDWSWDYKEDPKRDGMFFGFSLSQPIDISPGGKRLCTFTPSISTGINSNKYIDDTIITHINYGLEWEVPLGEHLSVFAYLNYLQGLNPEWGYVDQYPWGGMGVQMKF